MSSAFENGAKYNLLSPVGPNWVVLDSALRVFVDLDWFCATFFRPFYPHVESTLLAYPRAGVDGRYYNLKSGGRCACGRRAQAPGGRPDRPRDHHPLGKGCRAAQRAAVIPAGAGRG